MKGKKNKINNKKKRFLFSVFFLVFFLFFGFSRRTQAADLYLSPPSGNYNQGDVFLISVLVDVGDKETANAAQGMLSYDPNVLEVLNVSVNNSIFTAWTELPSFSNSDGTVNFVGGLPDPGYTGDVGLIFEVSFQAKLTGMTEVSWINSLVLANDGSATNILDISSGGKYFIDSKKEITEQSPEEQSPEGESLGEQSSGEQPQEKQIQEEQSPEKESLTTESDTDPPEYLTIKEIERENLSIPKVGFIFEAYDKGSGIDYFKIQIDGREVGDWYNSEGNNYITPYMETGEHILAVRAYDRANNYISNSHNFKVEEVEIPKITHASASDNEVLLIKGNSLPGLLINVFIRNSKGKTQRHSAFNDHEGNFILILDRPEINEGEYSVWAQALNKYGGKSKNSEAVDLKVDRFSKLEKQFNYFKEKIEILKKDLHNWKLLISFLAFIAIFNLILLAWLGNRRKKINF